MPLAHDSPRVLLRQPGESVDLPRRWGNSAWGAEKVTKFEIPTTSSEQRILTSWWVVIASVMQRP